MAFNLEFKITYDELAPSLQDMFKSLQGQITDNRNEITNINLDISDITNEINNINNHLTQIDNSITNIKNDITNIEGDITEINKNITNIQEDITNIQGDISNIENNITQIEGDITDLGDQITEINNNITIINDKLEEVDPDTISNLDFLNLAPKIGYYQDDTIEVISKYNMNHQRGAVVIYHDNKGQEILYFGANDGSYTEGETYKCFKAVRTDTNSPFIFYNEPLEIPYIKDLSSRVIIYFLGCGNYYMIVYVSPVEKPTSQADSLNKCHLYLYNTGYSSDESTWTGKDIYPLVYKTINEQIYGSTNSQYVNDFLGNYRITFFYNRNNNLLFMWFQKNAKPTDSNLMTLLIVNVSTESFVRKITLPNVFKYIGCSDSYSFSNTQHITEADSANATISNTLTEGWEAWRFIWYPEQEILKVCAVDKSINYYHWPHNGTSYTTNFSFIFTFQVPRAVWDSGSNVNIVDYNSRNYGPGMANPHYGNSGSNNLLIGRRNSKINCRDETNNTLTVTSMFTHESFSAIIGKLDANRMDVTQQKNDPNGWLYYGQNSQLLIPDLYFASPDASLWGKGWNYAVSCSNKVLLNSVSFQNSKTTTSNIMVSSFRRVGTNSDGITIVRPNQYTVMNATKGKEAPDGGDVFPVFSQPNSMRFTCTLEDYPRYYRADCSANGLGINLWIRQSTLNSDNKEFTYHSATKAVTFKPPRYTGSGTTNYYLNENYGGAKQEFAGVFYNPLGDYYIYFVRDLNSTVSTSSTRNKIYFIVVEPSNGNAHYFGNESFNSWNETVRNNLNAISNSSNSFTLLVYNSTTIDSRTMMFIMYFNNNSINNTYGVRFVFKITLSSDFNSFTGVSVPYPPGIHPDNGYNYCYGGSTIGFISANRNWYSSPIYLYTQKPLPGISGGTSYTIDQFLTGAQYNKYAIYTESNQGLVGYVPSTNIFLGGYYTVIQNPIQFTCTPNANNYIYLERGIDRDTINVQVSTSLHIQEGERMFSRICIAKITTNGETLTNVEYYRINIGYNDYVWNGGGNN